MKKRVKLITTIASLCLAVALMAFGVYAATNVSFSITNNVSFAAAANVKAIVWHTTSVEKCTQTGATTDTTAEDPDLTFTGSEAQGSDGYIANALAIGDVKLKAVNGNSEQMTYSYTITIKNTALDTDTNKYLKVEITFEKGITYSVEKGYGIAIEYGEGKTASEILDPAGTKSYTITITIDNSHSISNVDIGSAVKLTASDKKA